MKLFVPILYMACSGFLAIGWACSGDFKTQGIAWLFGFCVSYQWAMKEAKP